MSRVPFKVKAIYEYSSPHEDDLSFPEGQLITVTQEEDDDWYTGEYVDSTDVKCEGMFPRNFVEKYEPEVPSRPARPARVKKDPEPPVTSSTVPPAAAARPGMSAEASPIVHESEASPDRPVESLPLPSSALPTARQPTTNQASKPLEQTQAKPESKGPPPQTTEKPSSGSFKDRIAAFNKPAASPLAPFKPAGQGSSSSTGFIKKPFVPPPPSKSAYVAPPREQPPSTKMYGRDGEPDSNEAAEDSEASMPVPGQKEQVTGEEQPKPTSLKDRIALLQKQQLEQAARHAEAAQKKEKSKRSTKKQSDSQEAGDTLDVATDEGLRGIETTETTTKKSVDFADDESESLHRENSLQQPGLAAMSTPPPPSRELMSDTNDADYSGAGDTEEADDTSTSREDDVEKAKNFRVTSRADDATSSSDRAGESDEQAEEDDNLDPEIKRRMEIRERMAKMSGGMGLMGMFGPQGGKPMANKPRPSAEGERGASDPQRQADAVDRAPPVPVPGMSNFKSLEERPASPRKQDSSDDDGEQLEQSQQRAVEAESLEDDDAPGSPEPPPRPSTDRAVPPVPPGRNLPPAPPPEFRMPPMAGSKLNFAPDTPASPPQGRAAPPPPPPRPSVPLSPGELSDDEMSLHGSSGSPDKAKDQQSRQQSQDIPRVPTTPAIPTARPVVEAVPTSPTSPTSPTVKEKRTSRGLPPLPPSSPPMTTTSSQQSRPPPPPPPGQTPSRKSTSQSRSAPSTRQESAYTSEGEVTEYDGDYDTDIASSAKHKDALKSHARDSSFDDDTLAAESTPKGARSPPSRGPPPLPSVSAPRPVPPVPPQARPVEHARKSGELPRAAPPMPPAKEVVGEEEEYEYDPYRYDGSRSAISSPLSEKSLPMQAVGNPGGDNVPYDSAPASRAPPPPLPTQAPPSSMPPQPPEPAQTTPRRSLDVTRSQTTGRRSADVGRPSGEQAFMATDVDLAPSSNWYEQTPDVPPPSLQKRNDILCEIESSTSTKRGGKTTVSKDVYILYMDYSQTIITATFDASDPADVALSQRHERPPPPPRQDQLESASSRFGSPIGSAILHPASKSASLTNTTIGDGSPHALISHLLQPLSAGSVLHPVGTRAYGATIYANLANASTQQSDQIRPGDVVTFRNAKFAGHRGGLHTKYSLDVGKPDHVAVVLEWDGTKRKIRVMEQKGKDGGGAAAAAAGVAAGAGGKVKEESYRVADLKSGEVRVWRVMGRDWVGWDGGLK